MVAVYGARGTAEAMIARIRRMHDRIAGSTPEGKAYRANGPGLLNWVQSTAAYGFLQAYRAYVRPLLELERDCYYAEGTLAANRRNFSCKSLRRQCIDIGSSPC
jgi:uncharacterized protein (DUF2236 family)